MKKSKVAKFNKKLIYNLLLIVLFNFVLSACKSISSDNDNKIKLLIGKVDFKSSNDELNIQKFDVAMNLLIKATNQYKLFPYSYWDTLAKQNPNIKSPLKLAKKADIDYLVFANVNILHKIMRTQVVLTSVNDENQKSIGTGYSAIKYIESETGKFVFDPPLLESLQRAMAVALKDSNLFIRPDIGMEVKPVPTLVIGPIDFKNNEFSDNWELVKNKEVNSYSAIETIFDVYKTNKNYVVYDSETRDSIYKIYGFNIVDNHTHSTSSEIKALYNLEVDYFIEGRLDLLENSAELELSLYSIDKNNLIKINSVKEEFDDDSRMVFLEFVTRAAKKLMELNSK